MFTAIQVSWPKDETEWVRLKIVAATKGCYDVLTTAGQFERNDLPDGSLDELLVRRLNEAMRFVRDWPSFGKDDTVWTL